MLRVNSSTGSTAALEVEQLGAAADGPHKDKPPAPFSPLMYYIFLLLGVCLLSPWNIVINCFSFFQGQFPASNPMREGLPFYMTSASSYPGLPFLFIMIRYGSLIPTRTRVVAACLQQALCMALLPLLAPASPWAPILLCACTGMATAVLQSSLMGLVSQFPPVYSQGFVLGQGVSGILASLGQIIVQLLLGAGAGPSIYYYYFAFAAAIMASGAGATLLLYTMPAAQGYLLEASAGAAAAGAAGASGGSPEKGDSASPLPTLAGLEEGSESDRLLLLQAAALPPLPPPPSPPLLPVLRKAWRELLSVFLVFFMTFLLFPNVIIRKPTYRNQLGGGGAYLGTLGWWSTVLLALFNVFDTVGRFLPAYPALVPIPKLALLPCTLARCLVVPVIVGCVRQWAQWMGDLTVACTVVVFALTNGCFASCACVLCVCLPCDVASQCALQACVLTPLATPPFFLAPLSPPTPLFAIKKNAPCVAVAIMRAPENVEPWEKETLGFLLSLLLNLGILCGSQAALVFVNL